MSEDTIWIDSHAHLSMFGEAEVPNLLNRAAEAGVAGVLVPATGGDDLEATLRLAADFPQRIVAAAGVHPHEASLFGTKMKHAIERALERDEVVAVGEIGLDYHYMNSPREDQLAALTWQIDLALDSDLPVVLHNRESWADLESILSGRVGRLRGVCHSFAEGPEEVRRVVEMGLWVGISGMVTFKAADNIREMVAAAEQHQVLVETDSPFLAPVPHRGGRNEPSFVPLVGRRLAQEWGRSVEEIAASSTDGFRELFGIASDWATL
ncbi:MAG: TatD family hydrolase [Thermoanaerobaculales bacterium]